MIVFFQGKERIKRIIHRTGAVLFAGVLSVNMTGCTPEAFNVGQAQGLETEPLTTQTESVPYSNYGYMPVGSYDSADTAILKKIDEDAGTVTLYNTIAAKTYTLNYDGTTYATDKYGTMMSMAQLSEGAIVNVNFYKATKQLVNIQISPDAWTYDSVTRYDLGGINSTATIGERTYALTKGVQVFSEGKQTDLMNIVDGDAITVSGIGYDIYSIKVESGHGYVRLSNDEALIGGWVEIGGALITKISEPGMLLTVPEGVYGVRMYNDNSSVETTVSVERNQEVVLDCSGITAPVETIGRILFHVTPETATLTLDGAVQDISGIVKAEYGIHQIEVSAPGYDTLSRYVNVGTELSEITINLDESVAYTSGNSAYDYLKYISGNGASSNSASKNSASKNSASKNTVSGNSVSTNKKNVLTTGGYNRVYIYSPDSVEIYVDGVYAGLTPMSFKKTAGSHTIILKKPGYETRSYTIYLYEDGEDMSISFSELEKTVDTTSTPAASESGSSQPSGSGSTAGQTGSTTGSGTGSGTGSESATGDNSSSQSTGTTGSDETTAQTGTDQSVNTQTDTSQTGSESGTGTNTQTDADDPTQTDTQNTP